MESGDSRAFHLLHRKIVVGPLPPEGSGNWKNVLLAADRENREFIPAEQHSTRQRKDYLHNRIIGAQAARSRR